MTTATHKPAAIPPMPFEFPSPEERKTKGLPAPVVRQWQEASKFFFFHNGLCQKDDIARYLRAQTITRLDNIAAAFDLEITDLMGHKRRKEGVVFSEKDKKVIIDAIISSITK